MNIAPQTFGLSSRVKLEQLSSTEISIVKKVKSRIIKKDAIKIIDIANKIRSHKPEIKVCLSCTNNICSKSVNLLEENLIKVNSNLIY
ncbi:hypothetical protein [Saccharicrinis aurantiacus]|uniref:hypothetical protein n=1 Tax=Saccharicrinis aurantiacus TaxID=1849719 RepID=UPI000838FD0A|nr:hypothetical protein [Saccharicrinis aurantiacus]